MILHPHFDIANEIVECCNCLFVRLTHIQDERWTDEGEVREDDIRETVLVDPHHRLDLDVRVHICLPGIRHNQQRRHVVLFRVSRRRIRSNRNFILPLLRVSSERCVRACDTFMRAFSDGKNR